MVVRGKVPSITSNSTTADIFGPETYKLPNIAWDVPLTPSGSNAHTVPWSEGKFGPVGGSGTGMTHPT